MLSALFSMLVFHARLSLCAKLVPLHRIDRTGDVNHPLPPTVKRASLTIISFLSFLFVINLSIDVRVPDTGHFPFFVSSRVAVPSSHSPTFHAEWPLNFTTKSLYHPHPLDTFPLSFRRFS